MKQLPRYLMIVVLLVCTAAIAMAAVAEEMTADELKAVLDDTLFINLFDVRPETDYAAGMIPCAANIPLDRLETTIGTIVKNGFSNFSLDVYLYGETGEESAAAAEIMSGLGFTNVHYLASGIQGWPYGLEDPARILGDLNTQDIYGQPVDQSMIAGKKLIMVNIWATYCQPCISEMAGLGELSREFSDEGVLIIGLLSDCSNNDLSPNETGIAKALAIIQDTNADYPHILPSKAIFRSVLLQLEAVPTTYFLNGDGAVIGSACIGARDADEWRSIIRDNLASIEKDD